MARVADAELTDVQRQAVEYLGQKKVIDSLNEFLKREGVNLELTEAKFTSLKKEEPPDEAGLDRKDDLDVPPGGCYCYDRKTGGWYCCA